MALSLQRYTLSDGSGSLDRILKERNEKERKSLMKISSRIAYVLPENVMLEILSWLPVKDVLQFKSVCKSLYSIISSTLFLDKHMNNYYKNSKGICGIAQYHIDFDENRLFELLVDETPGNLAHKELDVPIYDSYIYGPCDGIYYLHVDVERALWNPATNEVKVLPDIITKPDLPSYLYYSGHEAYGFGFDLATKDYKVVIIKGYWDEFDERIWPSPLSVLIYSLRSNSWRYWGDLPEDYDLRKSKSYIFLEECCYWLAYYEYDESSEVILSFDMTIEAFRELDVPDYNKPASRELGLYHGSIALLIVGEKDNCFDIWALNTTEGQWTKKFTMGLLLEIRSPVCHWENNKFVLQCKDGSLVLCNPATQEITDLNIKRKDECWGVFVYKESLVSIQDFGVK